MLFAEHFTGCMSYVCDMFDIFAEHFDGCAKMGNQLSTWNLSIQSAVDGENFNYNPDYNQVSPTHPP